MDLPAYQQLNVRKSTRGKRPLRNLTPNDKVRAIQRIHQGETKASVSRDIGVPESTLRGWCKNEHKLRFMCRQMNEKNKIEPFPIYKLENFQPTAKKNKLDGRNPFTSTISFENMIELSEMSNLNNFLFDINDNSNYGNALLEETLSEFLKKRTLPDSNEIMKHNLVTKGNETSSGLCSLEKTLSSISAATNCKEYQFGPYNLNSNFVPMLQTSSLLAKYSVVSSSSERSKLKHTHPINKNIDKSVLTDPFNEGNDAITYNKWTNETIKTSSHNTEGNDYNILSINNREYINNDNKIVDHNNINNQCNNDSRLLQWYKVFSASLNFLTLAVTAATLQPTPGYVQEGGNNQNFTYSKTDLTEYTFETKMPNIQSYYESEPEDLSIRSTVSKTSTPIKTQSHRSGSFSQCLSDRKQKEFP